MQRLFAAALTAACVVIYSLLCTRAIPLLALRMEPVLEEPDERRRRFPLNPTGGSAMMKQSAVFAVAALFIISGGIASAQAPTRDFPAAANPTAAPPAANNPRTGTPDRPPAATMPEANAPDPATTGQAPATSEKMQPEMDSVGGPKSPAGAERK
jgi:hypothetical protein